MAVLLLIAVAYAYALSLPPPDRVVLLPDADGRVGAVVVKSSTGDRLLDTAYAGAEVDHRGDIDTGTQATEAVQERYAAALTARPLPPLSFTLYYLEGSATELMPESVPVLGELKAVLAVRPAPEITVIGHTDRVGPADLNDVLSLMRAEGVRSHLVEAGVRALTMEVAGRGERELIVPTEDDVREPRNRRVEVSIR